jgi:glycosyltransferase involved in cell wall biosynthesis
MLDMPTVSVIIPTYNRAIMVKDAIQSVLDQTYSDYEIIVVDDGSTDNTSQVINELRSHSEKVHYIYQENKGRSAARNIGVRAARGNYIAFLDSDDIFLPEKLSLQVMALESNRDFGMVYSHALLMDEDGNILEDIGPGREKLTGWVYPELLFIKKNIITIPSVMVRTQVLSEVGDFDETIHICEDIDLWRRIAMHHQILQMKESLAIIRYRLNESLDLLGYLGARTLYYHKAFADDPGLKKTIQKKLFSEMYYTYGMLASTNKKKRLSYQLFIQSMKINIFQFLRCSREHCWGLTFFKISHMLQHSLSSANYNRIRCIYRGLRQSKKE